MDTTTAVCRECNKRFPLSRRSNQHRQSGKFHKGTRFCGPRCKQKAYRARKSFGGTTPHATVTRPLQLIEKIHGIRGPKTVLHVEVWGDRTWRPAISSDGVTILCGRLRPRALQDA